VSRAGVLNPYRSEGHKLKMIRGPQFKENIFCGQQNLKPLKSLHIKVNLI
jgi:hypothetical protein